jgi:hypothetical protein
MCRLKWAIQPASNRLHENTLSNGARKQSRRDGHAQPRAVWLACRAGQSGRKPPRVQPIIPHLLPRSRFSTQRGRSSRTCQTGRCTWWWRRSLTGGYRYSHPSPRSTLSTATQLRNLPPPTPRQLPHRRTARQTSKTLALGTTPNSACPTLTAPCAVRSAPRSFELLYSPAHLHTCHALWPISRTTGQLLLWRHASESWVTSARTLHLDSRFISAPFPSQRSSAAYSRAGPTICSRHPALRHGGLLHERHSLSLPAAPSHWPPALHESFQVASTGMAVFLGLANNTYEFLGTWLTCRSVPLAAALAYRVSLTSCVVCRSCAVFAATTPQLLQLAPSVS